MRTLDRLESSGCKGCETEITAKSSRRWRRWNDFVTVAVAHTFSRLILFLVVSFIFGSMGRFHQPGFYKKKSTKMVDTWIHTLLHKMDTYIITKSGYIHYNMGDNKTGMICVDFLACPLCSDVWDECQYVR